MKRFFLAAGLAVSTVAGSLFTATAAQAVVDYPAAGLTPEEFAADLGFESIAAGTFVDPDSEAATLLSGIFDESQALDAEFLAAHELDASSLYWNGVDPVEVYFINEGAGYRNQLTFTATDEFGEIIDSGMIFEDISSPDSILKNSDGPLALGEGVSLGEYEGVVQMDFAVISNGYNGGTSVLGTDPENNPYGLQHVVAYEIGEWIILGFEDILGGGDEDYNDVVFAVRGVQEGAPEPADVPEPSALLGLLVLGAGVVSTRRLAAQN